MQTATAERARAELASHLRARCGEIEEAVLNRAHAVSAPSDLDPIYAEGLRAAVSAAIDYGLAAIELGEERSPAPPLVLLAQARMAARTGVRLDTVLRRYVAGHALLGDFLIEEAEGGRLLHGAELQRLLRAQAALFDRLIAAVSEEYVREARVRPDSSERRRSERIERLLAGELVDTSRLDYDFATHHLGAIAKGPGAAEALRDLATAIDRRLLAIRRDDETVWAWLGGRRAVDPEEVERIAHRGRLTHLSLAIGEPALGLPGWRLTHHQARAALPVALRGSQAFVRYADVALLASQLQNDLLATSLRELYLKPLARERDSGRLARETLRAYFAAGRNAASAAAALGISRQAVNSRLQTIEQAIGRPLFACAAELEAALNIEALDPPQPKTPVFTSST